MTRNILIATLFTLGTAFALVAVFLGEKAVRMPEASAEVAAVQIERGARDYEQYCATCHGLAGEGLANAAGCPPLFDIVQRKMAKGPDGSSDFDRQYGIKEKYGTVRNYIEAVLISGIRGTAMPAWGQEAGGPLRRDQIENITNYIMSWNGSVPDTTLALAKTTAALNRPTSPPAQSPFEAGKAVFTTKACAGCHFMTDKTLLGPGLGGLFDPGGTAAYGENLPNGRPVDEPNTLEWILGGTVAFPEKHVGLNPQADKADQLANAVMPAVPITQEEYNTMLVFLKAHNRDGSIKPGADAGPATPEAGALGPTAQTTPQPAPAQPETDATSGPVTGPTGP